MGIKDLWSILSPYCERKPLYELQNKKVAIDLSCWICEAQNIADYSVQPRMYLRNLYFRTCYLLLMEVTPVFVLEGKAPELKYETIAARNALQFKGAKPKTAGVKTGKDRTRFHHTLKQCQEMLKFMGLACIKGEGEAESLCAYLNEDNLVDGIISQDSDCFAYGARIVYRNFSISTQGAHAAKGGSVEIYDIAKAYKSLNFGRNKVVALALLCGSDYCGGVYGIGKDSALKLFETVSDDEILIKLRNWRKEEARYQTLEMKITDKNTCSSCGHPGKVQAHTKTGCLACKTGRGCDASKFKEERLALKNEINVRQKALADPNFPDENLIKEFLIRKDNVSKLDLKWRQPDIVNFVKFTVKYLTWEEIYGFEKFLPILTRWQLFNYEFVKNNEDNLRGILVPARIKKARVPKGVPCYEIIWLDPSGFFQGLIPEIQLEECSDLEKLWSTIEPQHLVEAAHPKLVIDFQESKKPKSKRKQKNPVMELNNLMQNVSISEPVIKKTKKPILKKNLPTKTLDSFVVKAAVQQQLASTPIKIDRNCSLDLDMSNFGDEDDLELSQIIDDIVERKVPLRVIENLRKCQLEVRDEEEGIGCNRSSFFITQPVEDDMFEKSLQEEDNTEEYDNEESKHEIQEQDSFCSAYVPLAERLKNK